MIARPARLLWLLALGLCLSPSGAPAHPMGNFSISHYAGIQVRPEAIELRYLVDLAEIPTFQELQASGIAADADHPSVAPYLVGKARALGAGLALELNGQRLRLDAGPAQILFTPGAGGLPTMKLAALYRAALPAGVSGTNHLNYRDENFADRAGWKEIVAVGVAGAALVESSVPTRDRSRELSDYPVDLSSSPPQDLEARVVFALDPAVAEARAGLSATPPRASQRAGRLPSSAASEIAGEPETAPRPSTAGGSTASAPPAALPSADALPSVAAPSSAVALPSPAGPSSAVAFPSPAGPSSAVALSSLAAPLQSNGGQTPRDAFTALIGARELSAGVLAFAAMVAVALGALHALEPGHGKTVVAAYLVGSRGTARHALALGLIVTASHTAGVYLLGAVTLYASRYVVPERLYPWLGALSGLVIAVLGASLFLRRYAGGDGHGHAHPHGHIHGRDHGHPHDHEHAHPQDRANPPEPAHLQDHAHPHAHAHSPDHAHPHDPAVPHGHEPQQGHGHAHAHPHPHAHGHHHVPPDGRVTARQLLALGITGGIVPCPAALVVLLSAVAFGRVGFGLFLIVAFSVGLAAVLIAIGVLVVHARRLMARFSGEGRLITRWLPLASSAVVAVLGIAIAVQALTSAGIIQIRL